MNDAYEPLLRLLENPLRCPEHETPGLPYWHTLDLSCERCHEVAVLDLVNCGIRDLERHLTVVAIEDQLMRGLWAVSAQEAQGDDEDEQTNHDHDENEEEL